MEQEIIVSTSNLSRVFEFGDNPVHALNQVELEVQAGEFLVILGPSGAGKTTLLNMIGGIDQPTEGTIRIGDQEIHQLSLEQLNTYRREKVGWIFQFFNLVASLRTWENVGLALEFQGMKNQRKIKQHSYEILQKVGLEGLEERFPSQLSGGEQQRVAIARALVKKPTIILADEPTGNLDFVTGQKVAELMQHLNKEEGLTFIVVSHDVNITQFADRVVHLKMGKVDKIELNPKTPQFIKVNEEK